MAFWIFFFMTKFLQQQMYYSHLKADKYILFYNVVLVILHIMLFQYEYWPRGYNFFHAQSAETKIYFMVAFVEILKSRSFYQKPDPSVRYFSIYEQFKISC